MTQIKTPITLSVLLILWCKSWVATSFIPKSQVLFTIRGGSDFTEGGDADSPTFETTVIPNASSNEYPTEDITAGQEIERSCEVVDNQTQAAAVKKTLHPTVTNAIERTGPAIFMLGVLYLLLKYTGEKGLLYGLIPLMQFSMYSETTGIIESFHQKNNKDMEVKLEKWWWFATVFVSTTMRSLGSIGNLSREAIDFLSYSMFAIGLVMAVLGMASHQAAGPEMFRKYLGELAAFHFALIFLVGQSSFWIKTIQSFGMEWVLYPALLVVINDTMAYVFGVLLGKHKLLPRLSPKKTVEGFIGAAISTCTAAIPLLKLFVRYFGENSKASLVLGNENCNLVKHALVIGLYTSMVSPFGGFLASAVKRAHGAKDFGSLIPGHGGVVDRFDCQVVTAPFIFFYLKTFLGEVYPVPNQVVEALEEVLTEVV